MTSGAHDEDEHTSAPHSDAGHPIHWLVQLIIDVQIAVEWCDAVEEALVTVLCPLLGIMWGLCRQCLYISFSWQFVYPLHSF